MHVTEKIVDKDGTHILSSTVEADGPFEIASVKAELDAKVIALRRTDSGGVFLQVALTITEPEAEAPAPVASPEDEAAAYLVGKGLSADEAKAAVEKFGVNRIQQRQADEEREKHEALNSELADLLAPQKAAAPQLVPPKAVAEPPAPEAAASTAVTDGTGDKAAESESK